MRDAVVSGARGGAGGAGGVRQPGGQLERGRHRVFHVRACFTGSPSRSNEERRVTNQAPFYNDDAADVRTRILTRRVDWAALEDRGLSLESACAVYSRTLINTLMWRIFSLRLYPAPAAGAPDTADVADERDAPRVAAATFPVPRG